MTTFKAYGVVQGRNLEPVSKGLLIAVFLLEEQAVNLCDSYTNAAPPGFPLWWAVIELTSKDLAQHD